MARILIRSMSVVKWVTVLYVLMLVESTATTAPLVWP